MKHPVTARRDCSHWLVDVAIVAAALVAAVPLVAVALAVIVGLLNL